MEMTGEVFYRGLPRGPGGRGQARARMSALAELCVGDTDTGAQLNIDIWRGYGTGPALATSKTGMG